MTKIFCAIQDPQDVKTFHKRTDLKVNILISYYYLQRKETTLLEDYKDYYKEIYLDSGAYTAKNSDEPIDIDAYIYSLIRHGKKFHAYFNLDDAFDDPLHNLYNQTYIEKKIIPLGMKRPVPVIHDQVNPFDEFKGYADMGYDFIAIGSNKKGKEKLLEQIQANYPQKKIHLFGDLDEEMLDKYMPYSADSATYIHERRYGHILYWDPDPDKPRKYRIYLDEKHKPKIGNAVHYNQFRLKEKLDDFLFDTFRYTYKQLIKPNSEVKSRVVNMFYYHQLEKRINGK